MQNPLVSERLELAVLYKEYAEDDHVYQQKITVGTRGHQWGTGRSCGAPWDTSGALGGALGHHGGASMAPGVALGTLGAPDPPRAPSDPPGAPPAPQDLLQKYSYIRKTRPDGNCFYRAFGFAHLEALLEDGQELQR